MKIAAWKERKSGEECLKGKSGVSFYQDAGSERNRLKREEAF